MIVPTGKLESTQICRVDAGKQQGVKPDQKVIASLLAPVKRASASIAEPVAIWFKKR